MHYADLVSIYFQQSNMLQTYWTVYIVVIGGLLAVAAIRREPDIAVAILATILYCAFAHKNLGAIHDVALTRKAVLQAIQQFDATAGNAVDNLGVSTFKSMVVPTLQSTDFVGVRLFHLFCDGLTLVTLWALQWRRIVLKRVAKQAIH